MTRGVTRGLAAICAAGLLGFAVNGCIVRRISGPRLTGTCSGACDHYTECKSGHSKLDQQRCVAECPDVFSDRDSLMAYESLSCEDAVEYVDGTAAKTAKTSHPEMPAARR
jgi:hypothetical protein